MAYAPCKNPACRSYGRPHPNCRCYDGGGPEDTLFAANGGEVPGFCSQHRPHKEGCEYFAGGGEALPSFDQMRGAAAEAAPAPAAAAGSGVPSFDEMRTLAADPQQQPWLPDDPRYDTLGEHAKTIGEGLGQGVAGPLAPWLEKKLGVDPQDIQARAAAHPLEHGLAVTAGFIAPAILTAGASAEALGLAKAATLPGLLGKAGAGAANALGLTGTMSRGAVKAAVEMGLLATGDEATRQILDPSASVDLAALGRIGTAAAAGAVGGGLLGTVPLLWKAAREGPVGEKLADFFAKSEASLGAAAPEPVAAGAGQDLLDSAGRELREKTQALGEMRAQALPADPRSVTLSVDEKQGLLDQLGKLGVDTEHIGEQVNSLKDLRRIGEIAGEDAKVNPEIPQLFGKVGNAVEDRLAAADPRLQESLEQYRQQRSSLESATANLHGALGLPERLPVDELAQKLQSLDPEQAVGISSHPQFQEALKSLPDTGLLAEKLGSTGAAVPAVAGDNLSKAAQDFAGLMLKKMSHGAGGSLGAALGMTHGPVGALLGWLGGHFGPKVVSALGEKVLVPLVKAFAADSPISAAGVQAALEHMAQAVRGQELLGKMAKGILEQGSMAFAGSTDAQTQRLDKLAQQAQEDPQVLTGVGHDLGHYMPEHATALAAQQQQIMNFVNQARPKKGAPGFLLGPEAKPSRQQNQAFQRQLKIGVNPLSIADHIQKGTLLPADVLALQQMHPGVAELMRKSLTEGIIEKRSKLKDGENLSLPLATQQSLSMFLGQPVSPLQTPASIQGLQATFAQKSNPPPKRSTAEADKTTPMYSTPGQARELKRQQA